MELELGVFADPISIQLKSYLPVEKLKLLDLDADQITRLAIRGLLTESERDKARHRLINYIKKELKKHKLSKEM
jgi:hypothetical protein